MVDLPVRGWLIQWQRATNVARVLLVLPRVERGRRTEGPGPLLRQLRAEGERQPRRTEAARRDLQRVIAWVDARMPGGGNCYRRSLLEIALDRDAAREPFFMGLRAGGQESSGHAWLGGDADGRSYDAIIPL